MRALGVNIIYESYFSGDAMTDENEGTPRKLIALFYLIVLAGGIALYVAWGMMYNSWNILEITHIAIYSFFIVMVGAGTAGLLLYGRKQEIL